MLRGCRILGAVGLGIFAAAALTPLPVWISAHYAERPRLEPADAVVVLGGGFVHGALGDASLQRVIEGVRLLRRGLAPLLIFTGEAPPRGPSEPEVRAQLARELGVPPGVIIPVTAHTTREEARGVAALLRARGARSVLLVSGSVHLVRARALFERQGLEVLPAPADQVLSSGSQAGERLSVTRALVRELAAWSYYRLAGYL